MAESGWRQVIGTIADRVRPAIALPVRDPEDAPAAGGAYALVIDLGRPVALTIAGRGLCIGPGTYVYAGSAYGPGGIRARLRRHFRRDKKMHWHVDWLTVCASGLEALVFEAGSECAIIACLSRMHGFEPVVDGFGSSDCRTCYTHLLQGLAGSPEADYRRPPGSRVQGGSA